jgi:ABC-type transport system involved in multi-copper enzyme maturation permease subunit
VKLISKPIKRSEILVGKALAVGIMLAVVGVLSPMISFASLQISLGGRILSDDVTRIGAFTLVYVLYLLVWGMIGLFYSNLFKKPITSYLVSFVTFMVLSLLWVSITNIVASSVAANVAQLESEQYTFKMLSITYVFSEVALFVLNPHYLAVNGGQYSFDWYKSISAAESISNVWVDFVVLVIAFAIVWLLNYRIFSRVNITPQG